MAQNQSKCVTEILLLKKCEIRFEIRFIVLWKFREVIPTKSSEEEFRCYIKQGILRD